MVRKPLAPGLTIPNFGHSGQAAYAGPWFILQVDRAVYEIRLQVGRLGGILRLLSYDVVYERSFHGLIRPRLRVNLQGHEPGRSIRCTHALCCW